MKSKLEMAAKIVPNPARMALTMAVRRVFASLLPPDNPRTVTPQLYVAQIIDNKTNIVLHFPGDIIQVILVKTLHLDSLSRVSSHRSIFIWLLLLYLLETISYLSNT